MKTIFRCLVPCLALTALLCAAEFWEKKKFPDWSEKEAMKILKDSPWSRAMEMGGGGGGGMGDGGGSASGRGGRSSVSGGAGLDATRSEAGNVTGAMNGGGSGG